MPGSSSSSPHLIERMPRRCSASLYTGEPQLEQKYRSSSGLERYGLTYSRPATTTKSSLATSMFVANAVPVALRHMPQWQWYMSEGVPRIS